MGPVSQLTYVHGQRGVKCFWEYTHGAYWHATPRERHARALSTLAAAWAAALSVKNSYNLLFSGRKRGIIVKYCAYMPLRSQKCL